MQPSPIHPVLPGDIEARSFAIITEEMGQPKFSPLELPVVKRAIHTSADFDYAQNLRFTPGAVEQGLAAIRAGANAITYTPPSSKDLFAKDMQEYRDWYEAHRSQVDEMLNEE